MLLGRALELMDKVDARGAPVPFSISFITCDHARNTGGEIKRLDKAVRCGASHHLQRNRQIAVKRADGKGHNYPIHLRAILRVNNEPVL